VQNFLTHIINHLYALGKTFDTDELNIKGDDHHRVTKSCNNVHGDSVRKVKGARA